ncbi:putative ATPase [Acidianus rod-shaped virus 1]|uniref:Putative ATPase n=1 Tax=Acidianus rod-shaped virus 1 TaxID=309181 RepID=Q50I36_9VIRU|nr:putative ATPase [Acidianus rod-shaped virus 1]CAI44190.1 putative ATPase [Acidianus rod-shaped virus 1]
MRIKIDRYKGSKSLDINTPDFKVGVVLGENGTGKTKLLKTIAKEYEKASYIDCLSLQTPLLATKDMVEHIKEVADDINDIHVSEDGQTYVAFTNGEKVPLRELGHGHRQLISFMAKYTVENPDILLVDAPEALLLSPHKMQNFANFIHQHTRLFSMVATQSLDIYFQTINVNPSNTIVIILGNNDYMTIGGEEALDRLDFEDLRQIGELI